jgi:hypothetical protein
MVLYNKTECLSLKQPHLSVAVWSRLAARLCITRKVRTWRQQHQLHHMRLLILLLHHLVTSPSCYFTILLLHHLVTSPSCYFTILLLTHKCLICTVCWSQTSARCTIQHRRTTNQGTADVSVEAVNLTTQNTEQRNVWYRRSIYICNNFHVTSFVLCATQQSYVNQLCWVALCVSSFFVQWRSTRKPTIKQRLFAKYPCGAGREFQG